MKTTLGCLRRADNDFKLISDGDRIAIGVSGGKDSLLMLHALALYKKFAEKNFTLHAFVLTMGYKPLETDVIQALCDELEIPLTIHDTDLYNILFEKRKEKNPCALCAKIRRGTLCDLANQHNMNKLALGHHRDDAVETLFMSLFFEGRFHTFEPKSYLSRADLTLIRPLIYLPESHILHMEQLLNLPVQKNACPIDGHTSREKVKQLIKTMSDQYPDLQDRVLKALQRDNQYSLWQKNKADCNNCNNINNKVDNK